MKWKDLFKREAPTEKAIMVNPNASIPFNFADIEVNSDNAMNVPPYVASVQLLSMSTAKLSKHVMCNGKRDPTHTVEALLRQPNEFMDGYTLFQEAEIQRLNEGNAYIHITRNDIGEAIQLMLINRSYVSQRIDGNKMYYVINQGDTSVIVPPGDMIHVKSPFLDSSLLKGIGYSTILNKQLKLWLQAQAHQQAYFENGSDPLSILGTDAKLDKEAKESVRAAWQDMNRGTDRYKVAVVDAGLRYQKVGVPFKDLEMNQMFAQLTKEIASTFNVQPSMVGHDGTTNTYSNVESQQLQFLQNALLPGLTAWEAQLQKLFPPGSPYSIKHNYETLLRADSTARAERLTKLVGSQIITTDEARQLEGLEANA